MSAPVIDVSAALLFRDGKLLIAQRHEDSHLGGLWEFPGGKREPGESFQECLARELEEELGVKVDVGCLVESITHSYPGKTVHLRFFRCSLETGEPKPVGCAAVQWVTPETLSCFEFPAADARLLEKLRASRDLWADTVSPDPQRAAERFINR